MTKPDLVWIIPRRRTKPQESQVEVFVLYMLLGMVTAYWLTVLLYRLGI